MSLYIRWHEPQDAEWEYQTGIGVGRAAAMLQDAQRYLAADWPMRTQKEVRAYLRASETLQGAFWDVCSRSRTVQT